MITGPRPGYQTFRADARVGSEGLVVTARGKHPIPSRTRPLSSVAPMVLRLKTWESRSPPDQYLTSLSSPMTHPPNKLGGARFGPQITNPKSPNTHDAGWSSPVARQAHNLKVVGSNPTPATNKINDLGPKLGLFHVARFARKCNMISAIPNAFHFTPAAPRNMNATWIIGGRR